MRAAALSGPTLRARCATAAAEHHRRSPETRNGNSTAAPIDAHPSPIRQLRQIAKEIERPGICEGLRVLHRTPVNHVAHSELCDLAADRARNVGDRDDLLRKVMRARVRPDLLPDALLELLSQLLAVRQGNEQHNANVEARVRLLILPDDQTLDDLRQLFDLAIDLRGADANAARIERRVAASIDHETIMLGQLRPVAVSPRVRILLEVGGAVLRPVRIVPERNRHAWKRRGAHELTLLSDERGAVVVEYLHLHPESARLKLAAPHGPDRVSKGEARDDIGSAADA